jgi:hypothetical protein
LILAALFVAVFAAPASAADTQQAAICLRDALLKSGLATSAEIAQTPLTIYFVYKPTHAHQSMSVDSGADGTVIFSLDIDGRPGFDIGAILLDSCPGLTQEMVVTAR